jgi:hypothetical protein
MTFQPGQSGNPQGRKKEDARVKELVRVHTEAAIAALVRALDNEKTCVPAAVALLDRGYGKPAQEITGPEGSDLLSDITIRLVRAAVLKEELPPYEVQSQDPNFMVKFR